MRILGVFLLFAAVAFAQDRETGSCENCGATTYGARRTLQTGNVKYITIGAAPAPAYCQRSRVASPTGTLGPGTGAVFAPPPGQPAPELGPPPWEQPKEKVEKDEEAHSGFGALPWVIGILIAMGLLVRFFLK